MVEAESLGGRSKGISHVHADEEIAAAIVGKPGSVVETQGLVVLSGQKRPSHALALEHFSEFAGQGQGEIFFLKWCRGFRGAAILAAVARIDNDGCGCCGRESRGQKAEPHSQK